MTKHRFRITGGFIVCLNSDTGTYMDLIAIDQERLID